MTPAPRERQGGGQPWWAGRDREDHRPPAARGPGSRRGFGKTWWGRAWVEALESRAALDVNRLPRGRGYARRGTVSELDVAPGRVTAAVQGTRPSPYAVTVSVRAFTAAEWERVFGVIAAKLGRTAALLDGELPPEVVDDAADAGLSLLPSAGEVRPRCSCPDWADPCKHSAAVCYLVADELDRDPFALLLLRGRSRDQVLSELRSRRSAGGAGAERVEAEQDEGVVARVAYANRSNGDAAQGRPAPVPAVPVPAEHPGRPASLSLTPPAESGISAGALAALAADAAARAWELAVGDGDGGLGLSLEQDVARRAAGLLGTPELTEFARATGHRPRDLTGRAIAWREGGAGGLAALLDQWSPEPDALAEGVAAVAAAFPEEPVTTRRNRLTCGRCQLRYGGDGLWYAFVKAFGNWDLAGAPAADPATALSAIRHP